MDRVTVYFGQLAREVDILNTGRNAMVGLAKLASAVLGSTTIVDGFTVTPTTPASLNILVDAGAIYQLANLEQSTWSSLGTDTHNILKQGLVLDPTTLGITPPGTVGFSQVFLVEVQYQDVDGGSLVLPYYNSANPALPFSGPGNAGTAQNTVRKGVAAIQIKAGIAAATGTQVAPTADAGWTGVYTVTVANGATTITSGNISKVTNAPWIRSTLPDLPSNIQKGSWVTYLDTGTQNNLVITMDPAPVAYTFGLCAFVKAGFAPTGPAVINVNGLGNKSIVDLTGQPITADQWAASSMLSLRYDGTNFQLISSAKQPGAPVYLTQAKTFYVNTTTGLDTYDGTTSTVTGGHGPFKTIQKGINVGSSFNLNNFSVTINVAAGTYAENLELPVLNGNGTIYIVGDEATPANIHVVPADGPAVHWGGQFPVTGWFLKGLKLSGPVTGVQIGCGIFGGAGNIQIQNIEFGTCAFAYVNLTGNGRLTIYGAGLGGGPIRIAGDTPVGFLIQESSFLQLYSPAVTFVGSRTVTVFVQALNISTINGTLGTVTGTLTGQRYLSQNNSLIQTNGAGATHFPGTVAGAVSNGGLYL